MRGWRNISTGEQILAGVTADGLSEIAFSSMHIVEPEIFNYMHEGIYSMITLYLDLASEHNIYTLKHDEGYWVDIGTPESLDYVRKLLLMLSRLQQPATSNCLKLPESTGEDCKYCNNLQSSDYH